MFFNAIRFRNLSNNFHVLKLLFADYPDHHHYVQHTDDTKLETGDLLVLLTHMVALGRISDWKTFILHKERGENVTTVLAIKPPDP